MMRLTRPDLYLPALVAAWLWASPAGLAAPTVQGAAVKNAAMAKEWVQITPRPLRVKGHLYKPTCSNAPGTDPRYSFWFKQGSSDGLVVFFNGGGACWSDGTCDKPRLAGSQANFSNNRAESVYKSELLPGDGPQAMDGIFAISDARNPVRDWSILFVSYCTADVHSGSNTALYHNSTTGKPFSIEHRGWDNLQVIAAWLRSHVPNVSQIGRAHV